MKHLYLTLLILLAAAFAFGQWQIDQNFENITTLPTGWTTHDDGDGMIWRNLNNSSHAHSGTRAAFCDNYLPNQNADWLITPQMTIAQGDSLHFWTRSWVSTEQLKVYISTTGTAINNFSTQILNLTGIGTTYQEVHRDLSAWAGMNVYIGFLWNCQNYGILIDDVRIGHPLIIQPELDLPVSFSFFAGETLNVDFTPFVTTTQLQTASLSVSGNTNVQTGISGLNVSFSSPAWSGTENVTFTLHDGTSGLNDEDSVQIIVSPPPAVDLEFAGIHSPREYQFLGLPFSPQVYIANSGEMQFNDILQVSCEIRDAANVVRYSSTAFMNTTIEPDTQVSLLFQTPCTLTELGTYTAVFSIVNTDGNAVNNTHTMQFTIVERVSQGGPDSFGYRFIDSNALGGPVYNWIDISDTGTSTIMYGVPTYAGDDNFSEPIPLGFSFPFYGSNYDQVYVDTNGELLLGTNNWYEAYPGNNWDNDGNMFNYMYPIPGYTQMPGLISVYWDDLLAVQGTSDILFRNFGTAPNRYTVIQWNNLRYLAGAGGEPVLKFEVILHENGEIVMQYKTTDTGQSPSAVPHANGRSATVGIQNTTADMGLCYLREIIQNNTYIGVEPAGNLLHDELAIRFFTGEDTQPPMITHAEPGNTFTTDPVITATAIDMSEITEFTLHYSAGGDWQTLSAASVSGSSYNFQLPVLPRGTALHYYFSATDEHGNSTTLPMNPPTADYGFDILPGNGAQVLLAYSGRQDYQHVELPVYIEQFEALGINYDIYDWEEYPAWAIPAQYQAVFVYASTGTSGPKAELLSTVLMDYMDGGTIQHPRNVFMSSDGWASTQHAHPNDSVMRKLLNGYFRTFFAPQGGGGGTNGLAGPDVFTYQNGTILRRITSPIGTPNTEYSVYANSPDCIFYYDSCPDTYADQVQYPEIGASAAFTFEDGPIGGHAYLQNGVAATSIELPIYRAFYFSFDFSQLTDPAARFEWMSDLVDWFNITPVAVTDPVTPVVQSGIARVYPNPFNPRGTIEYQLREQAPVTLEIYNLRGQKVKSLESGIKTAGTHTVIWNGMDDAGRNVASGVYLLRLKAADQLSSRKIALVK